MMRTTERRGERVLVIDISYRRPDGCKGRYRRDAEVQTRAAAQAEERRRLAALAVTGSPFVLLHDASAHAEAAHAGPAAQGPMFSEVAERYWRIYAPSRLKASSRHGYRTILDAYLLPRLANRRLGAINAALVRELDAQLVERGTGRSQRRRVQIVLRSVVCRFAVEAGLLSEPPRMPPLPKKSRKLVVVISPEQAVRIVAAVRRPEHRLALLLAFHAGLRSCEIRALRVCDVELGENVLRVRLAICRGVVDTPKSGHDREVPLTRALREALVTAIVGRSRDAIVARTALGKPWGDGGLRDMFVRVAKRAGIEGTTTHHLRHGFITALLDRGVGAHVVKLLAGHSDLATTERYAHATAKSKHAAIAMLSGLDGADVGGRDRVAEVLGGPGPP